MRINTNMNAMTALNQSTKNTALAGASMGKLSSGQRINKAGDDAAGMAISEKMRAQIRGLDQAGKNTQDGISVIQTAEGAMEEVGNIVHRMRELSVQSANETNGAEDRSKIAEELTQLHEEINRISDSTQFNGKDLLNATDKGTGASIKGLDNAKIGGIKLNGDFKDAEITKAGSATSTDQDIKLTTTANGTVATDTDVTLNIGGTDFKATITGGGLKAGQEITLKDGDRTVSFIVKKDIAQAEAAQNVAKLDTTKESSMQLQVGANTSESQGLTVKLQNMSTSDLGLGKTTQAIKDMAQDGAAGTAAAKAMINSLDVALESVNKGRANLGAMQNRLETASSNLTTSSENLTAAESRIRDVDVAKEMMNLSKLNLLNQASQAMMSQAKSQPEGVMQLLR